MSVWQKLYDNFKTLLETTLDGELETALHESEFVDLLNSTSTLNGQYALQLGAIQKAQIKANDTLDFSYEVILQIGYECNKNAGHTDYNNAISDIEKIIAFRLDTDYFSTGVMTAELSKGSRPRFIQKDVYMVCELSFIISGRVSLS